MDKVIENFVLKNNRSPTEEEMGPLRVQADAYAQQILAQPQVGEEDDGDEGEEGDEEEGDEGDEGEEGEEGDEEQDEEEEEGDDEDKGQGDDQEGEEDEEEGMLCLMSIVEIKTNRQLFRFSIRKNDLFPLF